MLILGMSLAILSCSKNASSSSEGGDYHGKWLVTLMMGDDDLRDIISVSIDKSTITMTFDDAGLSDLCDKYGPSHTVHYTYKPKDADIHDKLGASLSFDSPLYFLPYSSYYISKVFIEPQGNGFLWWDNNGNHVLKLSKF